MCLRGPHQSSDCVPITYLPSRIGHIAMIVIDRDRDREHAVIDNIDV